jgi:stress response protein YsnF
VREEVKVSKTSHQQERRASEDVRREDVDVDKGGDVELEGPGRHREPE